jgi:hypothetical protein
MAGRRSQADFNAEAQAYSQSFAQVGTFLALLQRIQKRQADIAERSGVTLRESGFFADAPYHCANILN